MRFFVSILLLLTLTGCHSPTNTAVTNHTTRNTANQTERLEVIGALSVGIEKTIPSQPEVAQNLNQKVQTLAETPTQAQVDAVMKSIENDEAAFVLNKRIDELIAERREIVKESTTIIYKLQEEKAELERKGKETADALADLKNPTNAIIYGVTTWFRRLAWTLALGGLGFLLLRIFAGSSPIIGAIFGVVERIVAAIINFVSWLFPAAISFTKRFREVDDTATILVDAIEAVGPDATIADLKDELARATDVRHRDEIFRLKRKLGWK